MQDTTPRPTLVAAFMALVEDTRPTFRQARTYQRSLALALGMLTALARHTLTQALLALGAHDTDWAAFYRLFSRPRLPIARLQHRVLLQCLAHVPPDQPFVLAVDATHLPRTSRRMPGVGWRKAPGTAPFRPGLALAQRWGALHWLAPIEHGYSRAIPVVSYPLFTPKAVPASVPPQSEWAGALQALHTLRRWLDAHGRAHQRIVVVGDGSYDVVALWRGLPPNTVLLARTARNRRLFHLPPAAPPQRGARRKYGPLAPTPATWLSTLPGWTTRSIPVRGHARQVRFRVEGPFVRERAAAQPLFLVVMGGQRYHRHGHAKRRDPVPVLVHAVRDAAGQWQLPLPILELVRWLWQRWEVEVAHREMKSGFGVGELQCWHPRSVVVSVQWSIWLYAVCLLAAYRTWGICGGPQPPGRWRTPVRRWSFTTLWRTLRCELVAADAVARGRPVARGDWATKEAEVVRLMRLVTMSARL